MNDDLIARARALVSGSADVVLALDPDRRLLAASDAARERLPGLVEGRPVPEGLLRAGTGVAPLTLYLGDPGPLSAYEELRAGFTAAVSHELRTPLARLLVLLESAELPGARVSELVQQARQEVAQARELIDDVLFLGELETGAEVVALGRTRAMPILREVAEELGERAARAGMRIEVEGNDAVELPLRPRMLRVLVENLAENAIRYAGEDSTFRFRLMLLGEHAVLVAVDDGTGVAEEDLPRLFERFFRADRARSSRGTGLGLAIVKHVVGAAGGRVEARGASGRGLEIRCVFPR